MLGRGNKQKTIINSCLVALGIGLIFLLATFYAQASSFSSTQGTVSKTIVLGPLKLLDLYKEIVANGATASSIKFLPGLVVYWAVVILLGLAISISRLIAKDKLR